MTVQGRWFGVLLGGLALAAVGCEESKTKFTVGYKPIGVPVKISVGSDGKVALSADRELRTPLGTFTLEVALEQDDPPSSPSQPSPRPRTTRPTETRNARWLRVTPAKGAAHAAVRPVAGWQKAAFTSLPRGTQVFATGKAVLIPDPSGRVEKLWVEVRVEGRTGWIHQDNLEML